MESPLATISEAPVDSQRLAGRRILITGGASGIGRATAGLFVKEGARVALLDREESAVNAVASSIGAFAAAADVTDSLAVKRGVQSAAEALSGLDGLVNAAGIAGGQLLSEMDEVRWRRVLEVNLTGPLLVIRAALPFLEANPSATIVNVASGIALRPFAGQGAYAASKAGLLALTKVLAQELAPRIRVNATCPGPTDTPLMRANVPHGTTFEQLGNQYALRRMGLAIEQAQAILFMTGPESGFITGVSLAVDGGRTFH
jgi:NAD(P)-dependent dehydrogenase (short-subunit alcohol dehydrogenase family)